jgi:hypothetical protein
MENADIMEPVADKVRTSSAHGMGIDVMSKTLNR